MAVTVGGTSITFNDGTTQSTAAGAVNTTSVLNATAGAALGAVGTYALLSPIFNPTSTNVTATYTEGTTHAGSTLRYVPTGGIGQFSTTAPSGTWRAMGQAFAYSPGDVYNPPVWVRSPTVFLRIS